MCEIRIAGIEDAAGIHEVEVQCFSDSWSFKGIEETLSVSNNVYMVALRQDRIVGFLGVLCVLDEGNITNVAVLPEFQGQGIGERLLEETFLLMKDRSIHEMYLEVRESNVRAIDLYTRKGFTPIGMRKRYYSDPIEDGIVMKLTI